MRNRVKDSEIEKILLNLEEFCSYLNIGKTKGRELLRSRSSGFAVKIGNRWYAHKGKVDQWLLNQIK